jgi:hypothetical protein
MEGVVEVPREETIRVIRGIDGELIKYALIVVEVTQLGLEGLKHLDGRNRLICHG